MRVAVLAYEPMYSYIKSIIGSSFDDMTFEYFLITEAISVTDAFNEIKNKYDAFITGGGIMNMGIIDEKENSDVIIEAISTDSLGICKSLVKIATENKLENFKRVFFDFVHNEKSHAIIEDLIGNDGFLHIPLKDEREKPVSIKGFDDVTAYLKQIYSKLLENDLIDIAVTRYSNITPALESMGIKYYFVYPSAEHVFDTVRSISTKYHLKQQKLTSPAMIQIIVKHSYFALESEYEKIKNLLNDYSASIGHDFIIDESFRGIQIFTTLRTVKNITENFTCCNLGHYLNSNKVSNVIIAYGYGDDVFAAQFTSLSVLKDINKFDNVSAVLHNDSILTLSRKESAGGNFDETYIEISKKAGISPQILKKINSINCKDKISAKKLGEILNVTQRSACRYLTKLEEEHFAEKLENSEDRKKGRPEEFYKIDFLFDV